MTNRANFQPVVTSTFAKKPETFFCNFAFFYFLTRKMTLKIKFDLIRPK